MLRILVIFESGGVYEETVPEDSQIVADLGLSDEDLEILRRGEDILVKMTPIDPKQVSIAWNEPCGPMVDALDYEERLEAGRI